MTHIGVGGDAIVGNESFQIYAILLGCISSLTVGLLFSWPSPAIPSIVADKIHYDITLEEASFFAVIPPVATILTCILFAKLCDTIGRKFTLLLVTVPQIIAWLLTALAQNVYVFYLARIFDGISTACIFTTLPMYVGEVATPKVRGVWGNTMSLSIYFGQFLINIIGSYNSISTTAYICLAFPIIFFVTFLFMPETPYFYLMKDRYVEAKLSLQRLRNTANDETGVDQELNRLKLDVARQMSETGTWQDLIMIKSNRTAIYAGIFLRISQQLSGISSFMVYTQHIFLKAGGDISPSISAMIFTGLCTILNLFASYFLDRFGRKRSYFYSSLLCGIVLVLESVYFYLEQNFDYINLEVVNWIPLVGMILYMVFYSFGLGIVPTLMLGELFSTSIKGKALCLMSIVYSILVSTVTKLFNLLDTGVGLYAPFLMFALACFMSAVLSRYFVPETKGKTLEEIQQELKKSPGTNTTNRAI